MHAISPFTVKNDKAISVWYWTIFPYIVIFIYISLMSTSLFLMIQSGFLYKTFSTSYLIAAIGCFEIVFCNCTYVILILFSALVKNKQIQLLNQIHDIDRMLVKNFPNTFIDYCYYRKISWIVFSISWIYYYLLGAMIIGKLYQYNALTVENFIFVMCYGYEQATTGTLAACFICYVSQLHIRFVAIKNLKLSLFSDNNIENERKFMQNVSTLLQLYKNLTELIPFINKYCGLAMIMRYLHDFTLTTSQIYLIFWIVIDNHDNDKMELICYVIYWMLQNIFKIVGISVITQLTMNEVLC